MPYGTDRLSHGGPGRRGIYPCTELAPEQVTEAGNVQATGEEVGSLHEWWTIDLIASSLRLGQGVNASVGRLADRALVHRKPHLVYLRSAPRYSQSW
jgi:hypothetical protein